jgi:hypothetical protein
MPLPNEIVELTTREKGVVVLYAKFNDKLIPVKVTSDGTLVSTLTVGDIQLGAVEIKDKDLDVRASVTPTNELRVEVVPKEFIWPQEDLNVTTIDTVLKTINCRSIKSKSFYLKNTGANDIILTISASVDGTNFFPKLQNQTIAPGNYIIYTESDVFYSIQISGHTSLNTSTLSFSGYGLSD